MEKIEINMMPEMMGNSIDNQMMSGKITGNETLDSLPLAIAYVPMQKWKNIYAEDVGFSRGTIFSDLDLPFMGK